MMYRGLLMLLLWLGAPALSAWASDGSRSVQHGEYQIHYQVLNTTFLRPEVAAAYEVVRARNRSLVMVSVRRGSELDSTPQRALVTGTHSDLIHTHTLNFRELEQRGAIYYIAEFPHGREESRQFKLQVQPGAGNQPSYPLEFTQMVYWER